MEITKINRAIATSFFISILGLILLILMDVGVPLSYGYVIIPLMLWEILFISTSYLTLIKEIDRSIFYLFLNGIGLFSNLYLIWGQLALAKTA